MMMGSFLFKQKAREVLKGNWQTALVVSFFSGVFLTIAQVLQTVTLQDVQSVMDSLTVFLGRLNPEVTTEQAEQALELYTRLMNAINSIPDFMWVVLIGVNLLALLITPALNLSCNHYFISLVKGQDLGVKEGLISRLRIWFKALWLHVRMFVQIFLWSLLFFIPGIIAALRYSMAPYFMAEDPALTAGEALRKSKEAMKDRKMSYFMLLLSFIGWNLLISMAQIFLSGMLGTVLMLVVAQFMSLALNTYINASCAAFYRSVSHPDGLDDLFATMRRRMKRAGISDSDIRAAGFGEQADDEIIDGEDADGGEEQ